MRAGRNERRYRGWRGLVAALLRDRAGNALILATAMFVPLLALAGSAVDVGRVYVARARIQQACDAASLAGRWAVSAGQSTTNVSAEALKYFNFNFKQGLYGTATFTPVVSVSGTTAKTVTLTASTTMPMSIMKIFKFQPMTVAATCTASQDFVNTDIVLVLDTTASMMCLPGDSNSTCLNYIGNHPSESNNSSVRSTSRMQALRDAVMAFYDQLAPVQAQLAAAGMRLRYSIVPYSMTVNVGKLLYAAKSTYIMNPGTYKETYCTSSRNNQCQSYGARDVSYNRSASYFGYSSSAWDGCIEERQTTSSITSSTTSIPSSAFDLDIDMIPTTSVTTRWQPYDPSAQTYNTYNGCPVEAVRLKTWTRSDLQTYVNSLPPMGATYHDIGMIWAGRMISSAGVFPDSPTTYNGMPVNKYIIFMSDGVMETDPYYYSAYGTEQASNRVTGGDYSTQDARHGNRFNLTCQNLKNRGASIWVVLLSAAPDANLSACATNAGQVSSSSNSADLVQKFVDIGKNIGALRLSQ